MQKGTVYVHRHPGYSRTQPYSFILCILPWIYYHELKSWQLRFRGSPLSGFVYNKDLIPILINNFQSVEHVLQYFVLLGGERRTNVGPRGLLRSRRFVSVFWHDESTGNVSPRKLYQSGRASRLFWRSCVARRWLGSVLCSCYRLPIPRKTRQLPMQQLHPLLTCLRTGNCLAGVFNFKHTDCSCSPRKSVWRSGMSVRPSQ